MTARPPPESLEGDGTSTIGDALQQLRGDRLVHQHAPAHGTEPQVEQLAFEVGQRGSGPAVCKKTVAVGSWRLLVHTQPSSR